MHGYQVSHLSQAILRGDIYTDWPLSMAWIELRILMAKLVYHFDFEIVDKNLNWLGQQECYTLWQKPDLFVKAIPVVKT